MGVPFDYFVAEACAAYSPMPGAAKVCFHYLGEELSPTDYTFLECMELLLQSRG